MLQIRVLDIGLELYIKDHFFILKIMYLTSSSHLSEYWFKVSIPVTTLFLRYLGYCHDRHAMLVQSASVVIVIKASNLVGT